jgi:hypothetical protein
MELLQHLVRTRTNSRLLPINTETWQLHGHKYHQVWGSHTNIQTQQRTTRSHPRRPARILHSTNRLQHSRLEQQWVKAKVSVKVKIQFSQAAVTAIQRTASKT